MKCFGKNCVCRLYPDRDLGAPKKKFEDTFSAEEVIMEMFFPNRLHGVQVNEEGEAV